MGVDVCSPFRLRAGAPAEYAGLVSAFEGVLTADEWAAVRGEEAEGDADDAAAVSAAGAAAGDATGAAAGGEASALPAAEAVCVTRFRRQWSRKEAYVKARGDGLGFALRRVEFCDCPPPRPPEPEQQQPQTQPQQQPEPPQPQPQPPPPPPPPQPPQPQPPQLAQSPQSPQPSLGQGQGEGQKEPVAPRQARGMEPSLSAAGSDPDGAEAPPESAAPPLPLFSRLYLDEQLCDEWTCWSHELPGGHVASVVRGPVGAAQDEEGAFRATFGHPALPADELAARLAARPPPFVAVTVRDLVPEHRRADYDASAAPEGAPWTPPPPAAQRGEPEPLPAWVNPANRGSGAEVDELCTVS